MLTIFCMSGICVSFLWREETPHFICYWSLFVRNTRPSYFGLSKQSCRKAGFYIPSWSFYGSDYGWVVTCERTGPSSAFNRLYPPLHTLRFITSQCSKLYCSALDLKQKGRLLPAWRRMINKRLWSSAHWKLCGPLPFRQFRELQRLTSHQQELLFFST